jgi:hypothetical protein
MVRESESLQQIVQDFAARLKHDFASEIERDPRGFKRRVIRTLNSELPPRPGRPCIAVVSRAVEMRARGQSWQQVYAVCLASDQERSFRQLAQSRLRSAVRARRKRKKSTGIDDWDYQELDLYSG